MRILRERRQTFTGQPQKRLQERASDTMTSSRMFNSTYWFYFYYLPL